MEADGAERPGAGLAHLASRMLPAFGIGVMGTFLVYRWSWAISTPLQRSVFALGALAVVAGLAIDWWTLRLTDDEPG